MRMRPAEGWKIFSGRICDLVVIENLRNINETGIIQKKYKEV